MENGLYRLFLAPLFIGFAATSFALPAAQQDFNGDGYADVIWRHASTGQNYMYPMNGNQILASEGYLRTVSDTDWNIVGIGDFNGDGRADVLWRNTQTGDTYIYFMNGISIVSEGYSRRVADQAWQVAGIGDFDGDGKDDVLWRNDSTGQNYVYPMNGLSIKSTEAYIRTVADSSWQIAGVGDFDGDGKADIFWRNTASGENYIYLMKGTNIAGEGYLRTVADLNWQVRGIGDFDGDSKADVFWRNVVSGQNYLYPMNALSIKATEGYVRTVADLDWDIIASGDYNGNGKTDLLWRNSATGQTYLYLMDGAVVAAEGYLRTIADRGWMVPRSGDDPTGLLASSYSLGGTLPAEGDITFTNEDGEVVTVTGYPGLLTTIVDPGTSKSAVATAFGQLGAEIKGQMPNTGLYFVRVAAGSEAGFIASIYRYSWLKYAGPFAALEPAAMHLFDFPGTEPYDDCISDHGTLVEAVATRRDISATSLDDVSPTPVDIARLLISRAVARSAAKTRTVFNLSLQGPFGPNIETYKENERQFLNLVFAQIEAVSRQAKKVSYTLFVVAAGNYGLQLDGITQKLMDKNPKAFKSTLLVGGTSDSDGKKYERFNFVNADVPRGIVYARAVNVYIPLAAPSYNCSGTSFAAPEVASVLDFVWRKAARKSSDEVLNAFYAALDAFPHDLDKETKRTVPADKMGFTHVAFFDRFADAIGASFTSRDHFALAIRGYEAGTFSASLAGCANAYSFAGTVALSEAFIGYPNDFLYYDDKQPQMFAYLGDFRFETPFPLGWTTYGTDACATPTIRTGTMALHGYWTDDCNHLSPACTPKTFYVDGFASPYYGSAVLNVTNQGYRQGYEIVIELQPDSSNMRGITGSLHFQLTK
jgi:hypothetical protein